MAAGKLGRPVTGCTGTWSRTTSSNRSRARLASPVRTPSRNAARKRRASAGIAVSGPAVIATTRDVPPHQRAAQRRVLRRLRRPIEQDIQPDGGDAFACEGVDQLRQESAVDGGAIGQSCQRFLGNPHHDDVRVRRPQRPEVTERGGVEQAFGRGEWKRRLRRHQRDGDRAEQHERNPGNRADSPGKHADLVPEAGWSVSGCNHRRRKTCLFGGRSKVTAPCVRPG